LVHFHNKAKSKKHHDVLWSSYYAFPVDHDGDSSSDPNRSHANMHSGKRYLSTSQGHIYEWDPSTSRYVRQDEESQGPIGKLVRCLANDEVYVLVDRNTWVPYSSMSIPLPPVEHKDGSSDMMMVWDHSEQNVVWHDLESLQLDGGLIWKMSERALIEPRSQHCIELKDVWHLLDDSCLYELLVHLQYKDRLYSYLFNLVGTHVRDGRWISQTKPKMVSLKIQRDNQSQHAFLVIDNQDLVSLEAHALVMQRPEGFSDI
jgi:hypothetical protein